MMYDACQGRFSDPFFTLNSIPLFEPSLKENEQNLPPTYLTDLSRQYHGQDFERYVEGKRVALFRSKVVPNFRQHIHQKGALSERLCVYDPYRRLYISADFNVAPMCFSLWQIKEWDFMVDGRVLRKPLICQVDEFELWGATTSRMMEMILSAYTWILYRIP